MATLPYGVLLFVLAAQGGGLPPPVDAMEQLQNDLGGAIARGHFSLADREKLNEINAVLGENIAEQRSAHHVDQRKMKAALKDIEKIEDRRLFADADRAKLDQDRKIVKAALEGKYPVYRGYHRSTY
jgi:hypothetical protein